VANLLVSDLIAYQGPSNSYSGPAVGTLQNASLDGNWTGRGGPMDVFSVFDAFTVTHVGLRNGPGISSWSSRNHDQVVPRSPDLASRPTEGLRPRAGSLSEISSAAGDGLSQPLTRAATALDSAVDQVLGLLLDTNPGDTLIGDLAFEQVSSSAQKPRGSAAIGTTG